MAVSVNDKLVTVSGLKAGCDSKLNTKMNNASGQLPIANGGTNASTAAAARTNLEVYSKSETDNAIAQSTATMVEYRTNTGDADTFADGITIVSNSTTSNIPASVGRCAVLTFTLLQSPTRKTQTALSLGQIWVREYTGAWGNWAQVQLRTV